ncbi:MAG: hypothetical protein FJ088_16205, partial [Deltaproteobacteria bacterium]|nr:hypothetical protein [Deltaproteobacteria bacterium]
RGLVLTQQFSELGIRTVIALNMFDEAGRRGIKVDPVRLSELTGTICVPTIATLGTGIGELKSSIKDARVPTIQPAYGGEIEKVLRGAGASFPQDFQPSRGILASLAAGELSVLNLFRERIPEGARAEIEARVKEFYSGRVESPRFAVRRNLIENAQRVALDSFTASQTTRDTFADRLGKALTHRFRGIFFLAFILYFTYRVVGVFAAQFLVDNIENGLFGGRLDIGIDEKGISTTEQKLRILPDGDIIYPENSYAKIGFDPLEGGEGNYVKFTAQKRGAGEYLVEAAGVEVAAEKERSFAGSLFDIFVYDTGGATVEAVEKPLSGVEYRIYHDKEMHAAVEKIEEKDEGTSRGVRWVFRIDGERG